MHGPAPTDNTPEFPPSYNPHTPPENKPEGSQDEMDDFYQTSRGLTFENVKGWLNQSRESVRSIGEMQPGIKYYYDDWRGFVPSAEWVEKKVTELKGDDAFISTYLGSAVSKALDVAAWGAQGISRRYYGEDWKTTAAGLDKIWLNLYSCLVCADELAADSSEATSIDEKLSENLLGLREKVIQLKEQVIFSQAGLEHLETSYGKTAKGEDINKAAVLFKESAISKIDETLENLNRRIEALTERTFPPLETSKETLELSNDFIVFTPNTEATPPSLSEKEESVTNLKESKEKEPEPVKEEKEERLIEQSVEKEVDENQASLIHELEELMDTTPVSSAITRPSSSSNQAIARFDINGLKLKDVLKNLPRGVVLAMMVYTVNQWKIKKNVMSEAEATKTFHLAKEVVKNLRINNKNFTDIVSELNMAKLITLKTCLVNYYYTK